MNATMDLSFPGQRTATATLCIPHDSVYMPWPRAGKSENGFFRCDTWLQIFQNDSKICEAEVKLTPLVNKICKLCLSLNIGILTFLSKIRGSAYVHLYKNFGWDRKKVPVSLTCEGDSLMTVTQGSK